MYMPVGRVKRIDIHRQNGRDLSGAIVSSAKLLEARGRRNPDRYFIFTIMSTVAGRPGSSVGNNLVTF